MPRGFLLFALGCSCGTIGALSERDVMSDIVPDPDGCGKILSGSGLYKMHRTFNLTLGVSKQLLQKFIIQELPLMLEARGFLCTVSSSSSILAVPISVNEVKFHLTNTTISRGGTTYVHHFGCNLTMTLVEDKIVLKDFHVLEDDNSTNVEPLFTKSQNPVWRFLGESLEKGRKMVQQAKSFLIDKVAGTALHRFEHSRTLDVTLAGRPFKVRISKIEAQEEGDLGIGLTIHDSTCKSESWLKNNAGLMGKGANDILYYVGDDTGRKVGGQNFSKRAALAVYFQDELFETITNNPLVGMAVDGLFKVSKLEGTINLLAGVSADDILRVQAVNAQPVNGILKMAGVAPNANLAEIAMSRYRVQDQKAMPDASLAVFDLTNNGRSIIQSVFPTKEERVKIFKAS